MKMFSLDGEGETVSTVREWFVLFSETGNVQEPFAHHRNDVDIQLVSA